MAIFYRILADVVVVVHFSYVAFVVFGQLAILIGVLARWNWVRNLTFRLSHLVAILVVVAESWLGITCPLTTWEKHLRTLAGEESDSDDFVVRWIRSLFFFDWEPWVFTLCYSIFGALVLLTLVLAPPRRKNRNAPAS